MKFAIPFILLFFLLIPGLSISQDNSSGKEFEKDTTILIGKVERNILQQGDFGKYFKEEYKNYQPCTNTIQQLKNKVYENSIVIVLATWCHDSQQQLGRFYKILDLLDYNTNMVTTICLDKNKLAGELDITSYDVKLVPTFIFYKELKENGRIIESPNTSFEKDILQILNQ